jgi:hypothetical protein
MRNLTGLLLMIVLAAYQGNAEALLVSATGNPPSVSAASNRLASVPVTWTVLADPGNNGTTTVTSGSVTIMDSAGDVVYATIPRLISRPVAPGGSVSISDSVPIPRSVMLAMMRAATAIGQIAAGSTFVLQRSFTDDNLNFVTASVNLYLAGGSGGLFQIEQMALYFDDQSTVRLVRKDDSLNALLDIRFTGSGQLRGNWELATPASTAGEPVFSTLHLVRQSLAGNQVTRIRSPNLPTGQEGVYLLRFRVTEPDSGFEPVYVRYLVTRTGQPEKPPASVRLLSPGQGALVGADTRFEWAADADAAAWQLEIFRKPQQNAAGQLPDLGTAADSPAAPAVDGPPVTGMMLTGEKHASQLSRVTLDHLEPAQGYWWRVRAIGSDGSVIAESPLGEFRSR